VPEAATVATDEGLVAAGEGWFVLNLLAAAWERKGEFGVRCRIEAPDARFPRFGISMHVLEPGQPSALYHAEETQEGFLVLAGECRAIVEGRERELRRWDYLHCPPGTPHVIVGGGEEPCVILMVGAPRTASLDEMHYPENEVAARFGASVARSTHSSREAYADRQDKSSPEPSPLRPESATEK
jgi:uncharacterized cupin superfamily protein